jgi:hypothetical protein
MLKLKSRSKPTVPEEQIKTADDLNILVKNKDFKAITLKTIKLYKDSYPCLDNLYQKNQFIVIAVTDEEDLFKINNEVYYEKGFGMFNVKTDQELEC